MLRFFINNYRIISMMSFVLVSSMVTFGMEKPAEISSVGHQEIRNLKKLYKNPNPEHLKKMLRKQHVPVVIIDLSLRTIGKDIAVDIINPYSSSFYPNNDENLLKQNTCLSNKKLRAIEKQQFDKAYLNCLNIRTQQIKELDLQVPDYFAFKVNKKNNSLSLAVILGNSKDILRVLEDLVSDKRITVMDLNDRLIYAIIVAACYPDTKKKNLQLLLLEQKKIQKYSNYSLVNREINAYNLLLYSAKNKEAFIMIAQEDPFQMNNIPWKLDNETFYITHTDRMFPDPNFDEDHIEIMMNNGGTTVRGISSQDLCGTEATNNSGEW